VVVLPAPDAASTTSPQVGPVPPAPKSERAKGPPLALMLGLPIGMLALLGLAGTAWWAYDRPSSDASSESIRQPTQGNPTAPGTSPTEGASRPPGDESVPNTPSR